MFGGTHFYGLPGDSKRALDEYISEICLGGSNTISIHNTCEDSLLASPIILDLVVLGELCSRIQFYKNEGDEPMNFHVILSLLSYLLKAPLVPEGNAILTLPVCPSCPDGLRVRRTVSDLFSH